MIEARSSQLDDPSRAEDFMRDYAYVIMYYSGGRLRLPWDDEKELRIFEGETKGNGKEEGQSSFAPNMLEVSDPNFTDY